MSAGSLQGGLCLLEATFGVIFLSLNSLCLGSFCTGLPHGSWCDGRGPDGVLWVRQKARAAPDIHLLVASPLGSLAPRAVSSLAVVLMGMVTAGEEGAKICLLGRPSAVL